MFEFKKKNSAGGEQYFMTQESISGIRKLVISPIPETLAFVIEERIARGEIHQHSPHRRVDKAPEELLICVQHGERYPDWKLAKSLPWT